MNTKCLFCSIQSIFSNILCRCYQLSNSTCDTIYYTFNNIGSKFSPIDISEITFERIHRLLDC